MGTAFHFDVIPLGQALEEISSGVVAAYDKPVIILADDEPLITDTLAAILTRSGFRVEKAYDGFAALAIARRVKPALLISDVSMPGMSGVELALAMVEAHPECDVLLFSGHATKADLFAARERGFDFPLLSKPVHPREIISRVTESLEYRAAMIPYTVPLELLAS